MKNEYGIVGVAHIGLPTNDLKKTIEFYKSLGFEVIMQSYNEKAGEEMYKKICENGYEVITDGIEQLPFWDNGVKFFMIKGPNEERIEFCQKL